MRLKIIIAVLLATIALHGFSQNSPTAKEFFKQAVADTLARNDSIGALHFSEAATEELKLPKPDYDFATKALTLSGDINYIKTKNFPLASEYYYKALDISHKSSSPQYTYNILEDLGSLYEDSKENYQVFKFPLSEKQETVEAYFPVIVLPMKTAEGKLLFALAGGSNDGVFEGAEGRLEGKYRNEYTERANTKLGKIKITRVYPNFSLATIEMVNEKDSFYAVYLEDLAAVPIRFPKKIQKDIFLEVSLLNIRFVDNSRFWIAHPRTLMYYGSPQMEKDVYGFMKKEVLEIYDLYHADTNAVYHALIPKGRFKGKSLMDALKDTKTQDLKDFLGFVRSYPAKYMGGIWKISEVYATWILNNTMPGSGEVMDSLIVYSNSPAKFSAYLNDNDKAIRTYFFNAWMIDAQNKAYDKDFATAFTRNDILQKVSANYKNDSLLAWSYFNRGLIYSEQDKDSLSMEYNKKARPLFAKAGDVIGESYCINNIGNRLQADYKYKESEQYFNDALKLRMRVFEKDTSDEVKDDLARGYWGVAYSLNKQSRYKESIEKYQKSVALLIHIPTIKAKDELATIYSNIGKSFQEMGEYKEAAIYYDLEVGIRKALGDEQAMADAYDNKAYLLSKIGQSRQASDDYMEAYLLHLKTNHINDAGFSMSNIGQMLWTLGKYDSAIDAHHKAIDLRVKANNKKGQAYSWRKLGALYKESGLPQQSIDAYNKALALSKDSEDKEQYASLLEDFASNYSKVKDYTNAVKYYKDALDIYTTIHSKSKIAEVTYNIATVYYDDKQYELSEKTLDSAITIQAEINDQSGLLSSYEYKGLVQQYFYGDYGKAIKYMRQALTLAEKTTSEFSIAYSQSRIGDLYEGMGLYDSAGLYFDLSLAKYRKLEDKLNEASMLISWGFYYTELAEYSKSRKYFEEAFTLAEKSSNNSSKADAMSGLSQLEYLSGNFTKAIAINNDVMKLWREADNPWGIASAYISLGNIRNRQSEFGDAIQDYEIADSLYKLLRMEKNRATSINNIGDILFYQSDYVNSLPKFMQALEILQKTNDDKPFISLVKANIGEVYLNQKKYPEAEKWLNESLVIARAIKNKKRIYQSDIILGKLKTKNKDYDGAKMFFQEAYELIKQSGETPSMIELESEWGKWFFLKKDYPNAEVHLQNSINLSNSIGLRTFVWNAYSTLADIHGEKNNYKDAVNALEQAIKVVEELKRRITGGEEAKKIFANDESVVDLYQKMAKYLKKLGRNDEALGYLEKSNIENLKLRLKNSDGDFGNVAEQSAALTAKEKKTEITQFEKQRVEELAKPAGQQNKEKIARLEQMTTVAEEDYQKFLVDLGKKYPHRSDLQQINAGQFRLERKHIPSDVALLSYLVTNDELSIFVAMKDTLLIKDIPIDQKLLETKIRQFYNANANPKAKDIRSKRGAAEDDSKANAPVDVDALSAELYNLLIGPANAAIAGKKRIAIVPSGLLCFVPFQSLATKNAAGVISYFGEEKQVFYVNKITTVTNGRNQAFNDLKIVAVGNADQSLANSEVEVKSLLQEFPSAIVYIGAAATKKNVLGTRGEYNILHLATHGILDYSHAENSYLVFASDKTNGDDGKLHISDIYQIKDIDRFAMVTLSACETAVVKDIIDGWPISTASAFIEAGVPTVIASLWKVDDKATSLLMEKFYANMKTMDKVAALQNAQMYLRQQKEYADPFYWAPFQLVGLWQ